MTRRYCHHHTSCMSFYYFLIRVCLLPDVVALPLGPLHCGLLAKNSRSTYTHFVIHGKRADTTSRIATRVANSMQAWRRGGRSKHPKKVVAGGLWWLVGEGQRLTGNPAAASWPTRNGNDIFHPFDNGGENGANADAIARRSTRGDISGASNATHAATCSMYW